MKKFLFVLSLMFAIFALNTLTVVELEAKPKSKKSIKKKKFKVKKQSTQESLKKLEQYFPAFDLETKSFDTEKLEQLEVSHNSVFGEDGLRLKLLENINDWLQTPYRRAGRSKNGVDCSNFTSIMVNQTIGMNFPASPGGQVTAGNVEIIENLEDLQFGDLIFFTGRNRKSNRIGHVGFYIGNGLFAHSSTGRGVIYTHISESYYSQRYRFGGRLDFRATKDLQVQFEK